MVCTTTLSRMNFSGYYTQLNAHYCMLFTSRTRVMVRIRFCVWFVCGYSHVFALLRSSLPHCHLKRNADVFPHLAIVHSAQCMPLPFSDASSLLLSRAAWRHGFLNWEWRNTDLNWLHLHFLFLPALLTNFVKCRCNVIRDSVTVICTLLIIIILIIIIIIIIIIQVVTPSGSFFKILSFSWRLEIVPSHPEISYTHFI